MNDPCVTCGDPDGRRLLACGLQEGALVTRAVLAVWAARPDPKFSQRLRKADFDVDEVKVRANKSRAGAKHMIWIATRDSRGHDKEPQ